ncbi:MAG: helix-turn-helix domain-containing protein [Defluviicoccus sp.]|nr:helix-turn-helix domain-containing protein [Defluviicoccus sp.]
MPRLLTIDEAAADLGVPRASLRTAAEEHGLLVRMGRVLRIDPDDIPELLKRCREKPKDPACTANETASGTSATMAASSSQRALATAEKLKGLSRGTSRKRTGPKAAVIPLK